MSDFCFDEDACHAKVTIDEGEIEVVVRVCSIVNEGDNAAISTDPLLYLFLFVSEICDNRRSKTCIPQCKRFAIGRRSYGDQRVKYRACWDRLCP